MCCENLENTGSSSDFSQLESTKWIRGRLKGTLIKTCKNITFWDLNRGNAVNHI